MDEPERDYYVEASLLLKGLEGLTVDRRHLESIEEDYECRLIRIVRELDALKERILNNE